MLIRVEDLGPIREAEVDLAKKLIIFAGPNNTGKTYLTWAIYGFERFRLLGELPSLSPIIESLIAAPHQPQNLAEVVSNQDYLQELGELLTRSIADEFAATEQHFSGTRITLRTTATPPPHRTTYYLPSELAVAISLDSDWTVRLLPRVTAGEEFDGDDEHIMSLKDIPEETRQELREPLAFVLGHILKSQLVEPINTVVFPVERLAINTFAKELTERRSELIDRLRNLVAHGEKGRTVAELAQQVGRYPHAIRDALRDASRLDRYRRRTSSLAELADDLEQSILGGRVSLNDDSVLEFSPDEGDDTHLNIQQSASVVKSLASLVYYLRHRAHRGDRVIIDEPELNLHPDNQRKVARILARMVNRGVHVLISTHSDYLIRELNNLIMLSLESPLSMQLVGELGLQQDMLLRPEDLGVYLFRPNGQCDQIPVSETGFEIESIDNVASELNFDAQTIYSRLFLEDE